MSHMVGADVAELRQLASTFNARAAQLKSIESQLNWRIHSAPWEGHDVSRFVNGWNTRHRRVIAAAAASLSSAAQELLSNAEQQERASEGSSGGINGGILWPRTLQEVYQKVYTVTPNAASSRLAGIDDLLQALVTVKNVQVDGVKPWDLVTSLGIAGELQDMAGFKSIGKIGDVLQVAEYADKIRSGTFDIQDGFDVAADALQLPAFGVVGNLGGAAIHIWNDAGREAQNIDWSNQGMSQTWDYMVDNPGVVAEEVSKATLEVGSRILGYFRFP